MTSGVTTRILLLVLQHEYDCCVSTRITLMVLLHKYDRALPLNVPSAMQLSNCLAAAIKSCHNLSACSRKLRTCRGKTGSAGSGAPFKGGMVMMGNFTQW